MSSPSPRANYSACSGLTAGDHTGFHSGVPARPVGRKRVAGREAAVDERCGVRRQIGIVPKIWRSYGELTAAKTLMFLRCTIFPAPSCAEWTRVLTAIGLDDRANDRVCACLPAG